MVSWGSMDGPGGVRKGSGIGPRMGPFPTHDLEFEVPELFGVPKWNT